MNFCHNCGVKLNNNPKFCPECGAKLNQTSDAQEEALDEPKTKEIEVKK